MSTTSLGKTTASTVSLGGISLGSGTIATGSTEFISNDSSDVLRGGISTTIGTALSIGSREYYDNYKVELFHMELADAYMKSLSEEELDAIIEACSENNSIVEAPKSLTLENTHKGTL